MRHDFSPHHILLHIRFYGGELRERSIIWEAYLRLVKHVESIYKVCVSYVVTPLFSIPQPCSS